MAVRRVMVAIMHASEGRHPFRALFGDENVMEFDPLLHGGNASAEFIAKAVAFRPDWIHLQVHDSGVISAAAIQRVRAQLPTTVVSHWMGDVRSSIAPSLAEVCRATHLTLISSVGQIEEYRAIGAPQVEYSQIGLDFRAAVLSSPNDWVPPFRVPEVVFCGNVYDQEMFPGQVERAAVADALAKSGLDFGVVGTGWPSNIPVVGTCGVQEQQFVYKRAKVAVSVNHFNGIELYYSDRHLHALFSGTATVCRHVPGLEREFVDGRHCVFFHTPHEAVVAVTGLIEKPEERLRIGKAGRAEAIRRHTFFTRVLDVYPIIEEIAEKLGAGAAPLRQFSPQPVMARPVPIVAGPRPQPIRVPYGPPWRGRRR